MQIHGKMKSPRTLLISLIAFLTISVAAAQKTYVVAVGLSKYKYPEIASALPGTTNDARDMARFFHDYNGSHVFLLLNENATRDHILKVLSSEFAKSTPDDEIIFVFSGHGVPGGLTCYEIQSPNDVISYNEIQRIMKFAKARRKIIMAFACYSGGLNLQNKQNSGNNGTRRKTDKTSVMLYTSSRPDEPSWINEYMGNSYFFNRILRAFKGAADSNGDRKITARELFNYVNPRVINDTYGREHPQMWGNFDDSMVVVYLK